MSVRLGLLALLAEEPMYGARLRAEFEARTGGTWPLNVGQVYDPARLERDGLVEAVGEDAEGRIAYRLTSSGRTEVSQWWLSPVDRDSTPATSSSSSSRSPSPRKASTPRVVQTQRTATLRHLQDLTRLKQRATAGDADTDLAWLLVLENLIYGAEAEVRWLDHVEARLAREAGRPRPRGSGIPGPGEEAHRTTPEQQHSDTRA